MKGSVKRGAWVLPALVASFMFAVAGPALASCAPPAPIDQALAEANTVFVGMVTALEHQGRVATFAVHEVWKGDIGAMVTVSGGPSPSEIERAAGEGLTVATSVDRTYVAGATYLVVSYAAEGEVLLDNGCSATQFYRAELDRHRPASAHSPFPSETTNSLAFWAWPARGAVALGVMIATASLVTRRVRGRSSDPGRDIGSFAT